MIVTPFSIASSVLFCSILITVTLLLKNRAVLVGNLLLVGMLMLACIVRLVFIVELSGAIVVPSRTVLVRMLNFLRYELFATAGVQVSVGGAILLVWIAVSAVLLAKVFIDVWQNKRAVRRLASVDAPRAERVMASIVTQSKPGQKYTLKITSGVSMPMIIGLTTPVICLPCIDLSDEDLRNVLRHEWTHYLLRHAWIKLAVYVIWSLVWWNPLMYILKREISHMLEVNCDTHITNKLDDAGKVAYLQAMVNVMKQLADRKTNTPANAFGLLKKNADKDIKERFNIVLKYKRPSILKRIATTVIVVFIFAASYAFVLQPASSPPAEDLENVIVITPENAYIVDLPTDKFELYIDGTYMFELHDDYLEELPFSKLQRIV